MSSILQTKQKAPHGRSTRSRSSSEAKPDKNVPKVQSYGYLKHANKTVIGFYQKNKNFGFVLPDNQKLGQEIILSQGKDSRVRLLDIRRSLSLCD
ncbi:MAG: hypothetical protein V8S98_00445 [Lachnospiraceae bacterium]